jgi:succinate dehydrogenase / fumarate reductase iron-sulfur subunit
MGSFFVKITRQDGPNGKSYVERFCVERQPEMNVISVLQEIAANPVTDNGKNTTPVAWDCNCLEEVCGACSMVINGRVRQACSALVEQLLAEHSGEIVLEPMSKFPVQRDLFVNRSRMFDALKRVKAWIPVEGYHDRGSGQPISQKAQEAAYPLSQCMTCGCCLEACPQVNSHSEFIGAAAISQAVLFNAHPTGQMNKGERLEALMAPGGIADCGNSQNCVKVCPKEIPLTTSIAKAGRDTTLYAITRWLSR